MKSSLDLVLENKIKLSGLLIATTILLFTFLGARELWTQEHRWADIVFGMFYRKDFLHPYLGTVTYYDKPLLSYWLMAAIAHFLGHLNTWALRLPSALSALLAVWAITRLGTKLKDQSLGLLAGWLLLTTFYFLFWARTSSADMLNLAGGLLAVTWYFEKKQEINFINCSIFFLILALTGLCKGLVGVVVPCLAVFVDICLARQLKSYFRWNLFLACLPACVVYLLPFWASSHFNNDIYNENGLYLVYRENILRYFHPFDHQGPFYTYFLYLPIYLLPWTLFFIPALLTLKSRWKTLLPHSKWLFWTLLTLFLFFTFSGSRRSYYILPVIPFAILFTADWLLAAASSTLRQWSIRLIAIFFMLLFLAVDLIPAWYYSQFGVNHFAEQLKEKATQLKPWSDWNIVLLDAESKINFYLQLPPHTQQYDSGSLDRTAHTPDSLSKLWPIIQNRPAHTIFITRELYRPFLKTYFPNDTVVELKTLHRDINNPVAFLPPN